LTNGSYRNHCCACLWSKHVDADKPGDRSSRCFGLMRPIKVARSKKGWQIIHRCDHCGVERPNKVAESTTAPDDIEAIVALMRSTS
jgi:RNHCP domain